MEFHDYDPPKVEHLVPRPTLNKIEKLDVSIDVKLLHNALRFYPSKTKVMNILCSRSSDQRADIVKAFKQMYDKDLLEEVTKKFRGDFKDLILALLTPFNEHDCRELYFALNQSNTNEEALIQILVTISNKDIGEINQIYQKSFGKSLEKDIKLVTNGNFRKLLVSLTNGTRDESSVLDLYSARLDAMELKRAGIDKWGTDASVFNRVLCLRNFGQIAMIAQQYSFVTGHTLSKDIKSEFNGYTEDALLAILRYSTNRPEYFARCLHKAMAGIGTDNKTLIRLIVTRCEVDMLDIKEEFQRKYGKALKSSIKGDTSGYYQKALLKLIDE